MQALAGQYYVLPWRGPLASMGRSLVRSDGTWLGERRRSCGLHMPRSAGPDLLRWHNLAWAAWLLTLLLVTLAWSALLDVGRGLVCAMWDCPPQLA